MIVFEKNMQKTKTGMKDELRPEYDLKSLKVRKVEGFGTFVRLENDVYQMFPDSDAVNEALRFLMRITKENQSISLDFVKST